MKETEADNEIVIGILGGMGPLAGIELQKRIIESTPAKTDQDHIKMICFTNPKINDRSKAIKEGDDFDNGIVCSLQNLKDAGATMGVIACNTAHAQFDTISKKSNLPLLNIIEETVLFIDKNYQNAKNIGLVATNGTINSGVYKNSLNKYNKKLITPDKQEQEILMELIYGETGIKAGGDKNKITKIVLEYLIESLIKKGADLVILGCTEFSLIDVDCNKVVDPMDVVARKMVNSHLNYVNIY